MASVPTYVTSRLAKVTEGGVVRDEEDSWHGFRGTEWQEILVAVCCSEKDIKDAWAVGLETFLDTIAGYEEGGIGPTFWYIKPEACSSPQERIKRYHPSGPSLDFVTNERFYPLGGSFRVVKFYARFWRMGCHDNKVIKAPPIYIS